MATLALVGASAAGILPAAGIGGFLLNVGLTVGAAYIDSTLTYPLLFGEDQKVEGAKVDDLQVQLASEGSALPFVQGYKNRTAGVVLWAETDGKGNVLKEEKVTSSKRISKGSKSTSNSYSYSATMAVAVCEGKIEKIKRIWANSKLIYNEGEVGDYYKRIQIKKGGSAQTVSDIIEASEGSNRTPAYRGKAYVVLEKLKLDDFGNVIPQLTFEVVEKFNKPVAEVIDTILTRSGMDSEEFDTSRVTPCFTGMTAKGSQAADKLLDPILMAYDIVTQERDGVIHFFHYDDMETIVVDENDLSANETKKGPFTIKDITDFDVISKSTVNFTNPRKDYQSGSRTYTLIDSTRGREENITLPLSMKASDAFRLAIRRLRRSRTERQFIEISLPDKYVYIRENDLVSVPYEGNDYVFRVVETNMGANGQFKISGMIVNTQNSEALVEDSDDDLLDSPPPYQIPDVHFGVFDSPALSQADLGLTSLKWGTVLDQSDDIFKGASLFSSLDGINYITADSTSDESSFLVVKSELQSGPVGYIDRANKVTVDLYGETLSNASSLVSVLSGAENQAVLGKELVGFMNVELIDTGDNFNRYELSNLIRGLRDTGEFVDDHSGGELGFVVSHNNIQDFETSHAFIDKVVYYKLVPTGGVVADYDAVTKVAVGRNVRSFSPTKVAGDRDGSNNLTISWVRRSKGFASIFGASGSPLMPDETNESYEIDILDSPGGDVLRTINSASATATYTAAEQTTDGLTPGDPVDVEIYQINTTIGRGNKAEATV